MNIKEKLIDDIKKFLEKHDYSIDARFEFYDKETEELRDGVSKEVYVISFSFADYIEYDSKGNIADYIEGKRAFAYYDAETLKLLYILKNNGYLETDGTF
ncbi:hypothetical protein DVK85_01640 [Flavobacterium arcticum]|uniref:Uncharacterized protein n=1 Tax=Flavobacterium arcticum TaxID=1784713 RepID=A0A345H8U4_9FLAO|nr:hypothetical protein [Flavobacterium arcticum]AXG73004.1 hypothetical protein DVK85_01640 [Flavobacterium arcticum]KAF2510333.1 hypothetical protein E0W72_07570 [Flavobacterium arcticum]